MESISPQSLLDAMTQELDAYSFPPPGELNTFSECLEITCRHLQQLQGWAANNPFPDEAAEIKYFKRYQPAIEGRIFYYIQAITLEQYLPGRPAPDKIRYYEQAWNQIEAGYQTMPEFYQYYRFGASHLDTVYFRRAAGRQIPITDPVLLLSDPQLRAPRSLDQARLVGYKFLEQHVESRIWYFQQPLSARTATTPLRWQASRAALTELIYGLMEIRAFGNDVQDVKRISEYFQQVFGVQIANIYATYEDNRMRKKDRTPFLNALISALQRRMDHDDLHAL